jgi:penicillin-binding protein 1A
MLKIPKFLSAHLKPVLFVMLPGGLFFGALVGVFIGLTRDLPQIRALESFSPSAVTRILARDKTLLAEIYMEKRSPVPLAAVPQQLKNALIATEDRKFYRHSGVDLRAILRAIVKDILSGQFVEGASTITQQLAKTLFLTPRKTLTRKVKEALLAFQLERRYTKDEILMLYLNQVYFGSGAYGVQSAAGIFFGKSVEELTLAECALVAGMPKSPSRYSPLINPDLAVARRNTVLRQMLDMGTISRDEYETAVREPLTTAPRQQEALPAPYFTDYIRNQLEDIVGDGPLYKGGLTVHTTLSYPLQKAAEQALAKALDALEARMLRQNLPTFDLQGAMVALDVHSGGMLAMVGGRNYQESAYNRAAVARRQPGSAFKPIVYACAIDRGFAQNKLILDAPVVFKGAENSRDWSPENYSKTYSGEMTLRQALVESQNIPAVRLLDMLGPDAVVQFARRLGLQSPLEPNLSLALGTSDVNLLELTAAYAVFPNAGHWTEPYGIVEIVDASGRSVWRARPRKTLAMSRAGAAIMTNMLEGVIREGTGKKASVLQRPVAGKTGTTNEFRDALFIGFSPLIAAGVWVGRDGFEPLGKNETGSRAALPAWIDFMQQALTQQPNAYFDMPDDVVRVYIDPVTGRPGPSDKPPYVPALFKRGSEPRSGDWE